MDFTWSEEDLNFKNEVIEFAKTKLNDDIITRDKEGIFSRVLWQKCADFGIQGLATPKNFGGKHDEVDILQSVLAMEALGYACRDSGLVLGLNAQMWTVQMFIVLFGTDTQKQKFLPKLTSGEWLGAHALTEAESGSDVFNMKMTAEKKDGGYVLNGEKCLITLAPVADMAIVFANVNPALGKWGITAFLVEKDLEGYEASPVREKMGLRTVPIGEIKLKNCFVPEENRLGKEGAGFSICNHSLEYDRCCILAGGVGAMERQLEESVQFAKEHKRFGQVIGSFQSVSNRIADMKLRIETSKLLLYKMAWLKKQNKPAMLEAAMLKLHLSESFVASSLDAIRNKGGNGYLVDYGIERDLRDAVGGVLYAGTSDIQRNIIAKMVGL
ncbi:acyl-CoA dehydrogenase family protein [Flavisolibacter sp. BT320]|nr:acyl-CoA dehydrogenase family protein [Flavisolibacter longurius]